MFMHMLPRVWCAGVFSALLLRFDAVRANADPAHAEHGKFPKVKKRKKN